eukprot:m.345239 g.345239  ORF g.345239 m.345239 type:complete len:339 (-) comp16554_c1_seq1:964-1980(-)
MLRTVCIQKHLETARKHCVCRVQLAHLLQELAHGLPGGGDARVGGLESGGLDFQALAEVRQRALLVAFSLEHNANFVVQLCCLWVFQAHRAVVLIECLLKALQRPAVVPAVPKRPPDPIQSRRSARSLLGFQGLVTVGVVLKRLLVHSQRFSVPPVGRQHLTCTVAPPCKLEPRLAGPRGCKPTDRSESKLVGADKALNLVQHPRSEERLHPHVQFVEPPFQRHDCFEDPVPVLRIRRRCAFGLHLDHCIGERGGVVLDRRPQSPPLGVRERDRELDSASHRGVHLKQAPVRSQISLKERKGACVQLRSQWDHSVPSCNGFSPRIILPIPGAASTSGS